MTYLLATVPFCIWILWFGGDQELADSAWFGMPGLGVRECRFMAWLDLLVLVPVYGLVTLL